MKSFSTIEHYMNSDRVRILGLILALLLAGCAVIGFIASFVALFGSHPVAALLWMFASIAVPLSVWLMVWHVAFSPSVAAGRDTGDLAARMEQIGKSVDAIKKTVKAMDVAAISGSLEELKTSMTRAAPAKRTTSARKTATRRTARASASDQSADTGSAES